MNKGKKGIPIFDRKNRIDRIKSHAKIQPRMDTDKHGFIGHRVTETQREKFYTNCTN